MKYLVSAQAIDNHDNQKMRFRPAILGLDENKGLSVRDAAVNTLDPFKPRTAGFCGWLSW
jgi:hypothetical protein